MEEPQDEETADETVDDTTASDDAAEETTSPDDEWSATGERLRTLGSSVKAHYDQPADAEPGPSGDELKDAASQFGRALGRLFGAIGDAARDPQVKEQAQQAGTSMLSALGKTFDQLGDEATEAFGRSKSKADEANDHADDVMDAAERELDDADLLDELKSDLAEDEGEPTA